MYLLLTIVALFTLKGLLGFALLVWSSIFCGPKH
jgi:hypothetical protein